MTSQYGLAGLCTVGYSTAEGLNVAIWHLRCCVCLIWKTSLFLGKFRRKCCLQHWDVLGCILQYKYRSMQDTGTKDTKGRQIATHFHLINKLISGLYNLKWFKAPHCNSSTASSVVKTLASITLVRARRCLIIFIGGSYNILPICLQQKCFEAPCIM